MSSQSVTDNLEGAVLGALGNAIPDEATLAKYVQQFGQILSASEDQQKQVLLKLQTSLKIQVDLGVWIQEKDHRPWLLSLKPSINPFFSARYLRFLRLKKRWPQTVVSNLGRSTDDILDLLGNPTEKGKWKRRGLVLGDVQSGKTATYTSLICSAADAGYRLIVLLTGTLENLRRQTQERLDEGFVGFDSSGELKRKKDSRLVGVGLLGANPETQATVFTSRASDFNVATMNQLGLGLSSLKGPAIVVVKKNKSVLNTLETWLRERNVEGDGKIHLPLLLIDDEADNASINIAKEGDASGINKAIRSILALFHRTSYVGFTATPFANIFVNPDSQDEMLEDDLFPRDFIYALHAPSNYLGAHAIFDETGRSAFVRTILDENGSIPPGHKQTHHIESLPASLCEAMDAFLVANAIRDLRGEGPTHRSMLVNVSRFTIIQDRVEQLIRDRLEKIVAAVRNFSKRPVREALDNPHILSLHQVWAKEFSRSGVDWPQIQATLQDSVVPTTTAAVNQRTKAASLDYKKYDDVGLRVIAVGGNSLSRGLTLEGLSVSYFLRTTKMYDTLLQMGRWFGYRDGYKDLCRVWMTAEASAWYSHISDATRELRDEIALMRAQDQSPADFGLAVRSHPDSLLVTARNKMRSAPEVERIVSVAGRLFESVELIRDEETRRRNSAAIRAFLDRVTPIGTWARHGSRLLGRGVPAAEVARLLREFSASEADLLFRPRDLAEMIARAPDERLKLWEVVVPGGSGPREFAFGTWRVPFQQRFVLERKDRWVISGSKRRVSSRGDEATGLTKEAKERALERALVKARETALKKGLPEPQPSDVNASDKDFRLEREVPLLMVHAIEPTTGGARILNDDQTPLFGLGVSFCPFNDSTEGKRVKYRVNLVKFRELFGAEEGEDQDDEEDVP